jgi:hypothetical protein
MPKICRVAQRCESPRSQRTQRPQGASELLTTRWPGLQSVTFAPITSMMPQNSWPITSGGGRRGLRVLNDSSSLPQMPQAATRSVISSGRGGGGSGTIAFSIRSKAG